MENRKQKQSKLQQKGSRSTPPITRQASKTKSSTSATHKTQTTITNHIQTTISQPNSKTVSPTQTTRQSLTQPITPIGPQRPPLVRSSTPVDINNYTDTDSQALYETEHSQNSNPNIITLSTPQSQQTQLQTEQLQTERDMDKQPTPSETNLLDDKMETDADISDSVTAINLSGILNKTIKEPEPQPSTSRAHAEPGTSSQVFLEQKGKRLKSALIILAKASHHKAFMETCLSRNTPPRNMALWVQPHIYHSNQEVEKEWRDVLYRASLDLTNTLVRHYGQIITSERKILDEIKQEIMDYLKSIQQTETRDSLKQSWKDITKKAEDEARQLSLSLKESRENKLHRKRGRTTSQTDLPANKFPQREDIRNTGNSQPPANPTRGDTRDPAQFISALSDLLQQYKGQADPKNLNPRPNSSKQRGKEPAHGRGYPRKMLPPSGP